MTIGTAPAGGIVDEPAGHRLPPGTIVSSGAEAVWVIDGATCNGTTTAGCRQKLASVTVGAGSADYNVAFALDQVTHTLYVANWKDNTLSVIDTATCNATTTSRLRPDPARGAGRQRPGRDRAQPWELDTLYVSECHQRHGLGA